MRLRGVHYAHQEGHDRQLRDSKGDEAKREAQDRPEDGALLLVEGQEVKVPPVAMLDGDDGHGRRDPLENLHSSGSVTQVVVQTAVGSRD